MGFSVVFKARICLRPLQSFLHQGSSGFLTVKTSLCRSPQLPSPAQFLCTKDTNRSADLRNSRQTERQSGTTSRTIRNGPNEWWDDTVDGRGKRQRSTFSKSVFAAGTARRTTEMLKKKAGLVPQDEEEPEVERTRGTGRDYWKCQV